jgi:predicted transcriptional regulator
MIRRSKLEIFMDIMKVVAEGGQMKRTRIMYQANLSWRKLKDALDTMEKMGVLTSVESSSTVVVTPTQHGLDLLKKYRSVESIFTEATPEAEGLSYPTARMTIPR